MDRRSFIQDIGLGSLGIAMHGCSKTKDIELALNRFLTRNDFIIVKKYDDADSLLEILEGNVDIPSIESIPVGSSLRMNHPASILYSVNMKMQEEHDEHCIYGENGFYSGSCIILNKQGYFLTANHVAEELSKKNRISIFYDPFQDFVTKPEILVYSQRWDVALGKVDIPNEIEIYKYKITKGSPEPRDFLFSMNVDPELFATPSFLEMIIDSCVIDIKNYSAVRDYSITQNAPILEGVLIYTPEGSVDGIVSKVVRKDRNTHSISGMFYMQGRAKKGHSGSPLFSNNKDIVGIVKNIRDCKNCDDERMIIGCVSPDKIRGLIEAYINA